MFEVLDPLDYLFAPGENTRTNPNTVKYYVEVGVNIVNLDDELIASKCCQSQLYITGSSLDFKKELCEFRNVYGEYVARILILAAKVGNKERICTGIIDIPLSRLEPNVVVSNILRLLECIRFTCWFCLGFSILSIE